MERLPQPLSFIARQPQLLIPSRLLELVDDPAALQASRFSLWLGSFDNGYQPSLAILIHQPAGDSPPRGEYHWDQVLARHQAIAIENQELAPDRQPLVSLVAHEMPQAGIAVITYVQRKELRGRGLGTSFYRNFEEILRQLGYRYLFGSNEADSRAFFIKTGRYPFSQVQPALAQQLSRYARSCSLPEPTTIKFLDQQLADEYLLYPKAGL